MLRKLHARHPDVTVLPIPTAHELQLQFIKWVLERPHIPPLASPASSGFYTDIFGVRPQPELGPGFFNEDHESDNREISPSLSTHQPPSHGTGFSMKNTCQANGPLARLNPKNVDPIWSLSSLLLKSAVVSCFATPRWPKVAPASLLASSNQEITGTHIDHYWEHLI
jgi:hypothetical protein